MRSVAADDGCSRLDRAPRAAPAVGRAGVRTASRLAGHVLVVEDNAINQLVAVGILRRLGYRADVAANGCEALAALDRTDYDAILMDCQMPEMDGFTATAEIRRREGPGRHTPVIAMTAGASGRRPRALPGRRDGRLPGQARPPGRRGRCPRPLDRGPGRAGDPDPRDRAGRAPALDHLLDVDLLEELREIDPDGELLTRIVVNFLDGTPGYLAALRTLVADGDAAAVRQAAHRLRGSSGTVGALHVTARLAELEEESAEGRLDRAVDLLGDIERAFDQTAAALVERCAPDHPVPAPTAGMRPSRRRRPTPTPTPTRPRPDPEPPSTDPSSGCPSRRCRSMPMDGWSTPTGWRGRCAPRRARSRPRPWP